MRKQSMERHHHMTTSPNISPTATGSTAKMFKSLEKSKTKKKKMRDLSNANKNRPPMANFFVPSSYVSSGTRSSLPTINRNLMKKNMRSERKIKQYISSQAGMQAGMHTHATTSRQITQTSGDYIEMEQPQPINESS